MKKAHRRVERRPSPHFQAEEIRQSLRYGIGGRKQIVRANARRHQRLVRVSKGRIRNEQSLFFARPLREFLRSQLFQELPRSRGWRDSRRQRRNGNFQFLRNLLARHFRVPVQDHIAQVGNQFCGAIAGRRQPKKFGRILQERGRDFPCLKLRVIHHVFQERNIRFQAANPEFAQRPIHPLARFRQVRAPRRGFDEKRIVIRRESSSGVGRSAVQADAEAGGRPVCRNFPVIRREIICRILRGHAALQRRAIQRNAFLFRQRERRRMQLVSLRNQNLRPHQVDPGDHFCDRVLHLDARIHFDEIPFLRIYVVEKLNGSCIAVFRFACKLHRRIAELGANAGGKICRGRNLHDFLMAPLHRAVTLVEMQKVGVMVPEDLHLKMPRAWQKLFQKHRCIPKS